MLVTFRSLGYQGLSCGTPHPTPATQNIPIVCVSGYYAPALVLACSTLHVHEEIN